VNSSTPAISDNYRTYYEIFVRSFYDSNNDGIGDLKGVLQKFDYINDGNSSSKKSLNVGGIWLMPVMPSPSYHKYDITNYYAIDPQYGTMADFEALAAKCKEKNVSLIMDLVLNHTSSENKWFQSACASIGIPREHNPYCKYYNFSTEPQPGYEQVPQYSNWYYECQFGKNMPDLNLDEPLVRAEIVKIMKFWLDKGVSGFRLDATTSYYTGDNEKNTAFLKWLKTEATKINKNCYFVGEAWSTAGDIEELYGSGIDSFFNFPFSQISGLFIPAVRSENGSGVAEKLQSWQTDLLKINPKSIDAVFLTNHDNGRSSGMLNRDINMEKMAAALYMLAPGNSFIYYGEELGMTGSGRDENKRLPMLWSVTDKTGIPNAPPNAEYFVQPDKGVAEQLKDKSSLLNYYIKLIKIKNQNPEIARGIVKAITVQNAGIVAYSVKYNSSTLYVIHNLSTQPVTLTFSKDKYGYKKIIDNLSVSGKKVTLKSDNLTMPARSSVIIK
jgi:glycosidase